MTTSTTTTATIDPERGLNLAAWERQYFFRLIWLFPAAFALHITEESLGFPRWVTQVLGGSMDVRAFYVNNAVFMLILVSLCALAARTRARWAVALLYLWTTAQELCNALFHLYTQVVFNAYSPGLFTAMLLYIPVNGYLIYLALRERMLPRLFMPIALVIGAAMMAFVVWAGLYHFTTPPFCKWAPFACG
ncbi:Hypothetical protein A7982_00737 [Minicystis rosea]|nr:Hypothetical protein A7982_00737 [Minicystis rosea]